MKILIVDDDDITLCLLENMLVGDGFEVVKACNGRQALEILHGDDIKLVITDWGMPEMDGIELCRKIRSSLSSSYVYVILLTSHDRKEEVIRGLRAGADDYMVKPFDPTELKVRVSIGERILSLETQGVTIFALAKLVESRDPETGMHLERIRSYSRVLALELANNPKYQGIITPDYIQTIYLTSTLHDIGKVSIPDNVLLKPGQLNDIEFAMMKKHAEKGYATLAASLAKFPGVKYLEMACDIAWCHHERHNGSGYPRGLEGEDIPLAARIVALADVYDALCSKRPYKAAFIHSTARSILLEECGEHFHPDIVEAFLKAEDLFVTIQTEFVDEAS